MQIGVRRVLGDLLLVPTLRLSIGFCFILVEFTFIVWSIYVSFSTVLVNVLLCVCVCVCVCFYGDIVTIIVSLPCQIAS